MKEISVDCYPGVIALFLLDSTHLVQRSSESTRTILSPYGFNHRNVNMNAINDTPTGFDYSLKEVYSVELFDEDTRMIASIGDNLRTPLTAIAYSTMKQEEASESTSIKLVDIVMNTTIPGFVATPPKIFIEQQQVNVVSLRSNAGKHKGTSNNSRVSGKIYVLFSIKSCEQLTSIDSIHVVFSKLCLIESC